VVVSIVVPVQQPHAPIVPLPRPPDAETADARACRQTGRNDPGPGRPARAGKTRTKPARPGDSGSGAARSNNGE